MKISKLFHWLYAILMLLPIFAIGVTCGYAIFNKNAYQSYGDQYLKNTQVITDKNQLTLNNEYYVVYKDVGGSQMYNDIIYYYSDISIDWTAYGASTSNTYIGFMFNSYQTPNNRIRVYYYDTNNTLANIDLFIWGSSLKDFTFTLSDFNATYSYVGQSQADYILYKYFIVTGKVSDVFYYSLDRVTEMPIFSWSNDSFVKTPIEFLTGLFGMANDNPILTIMSYWLSISIIWLMFDIVMYIPLLVHRLIDKGMVD